MDQSVAIQETLAEGEYCIIISFPRVPSSQPQGLPCLALGSGMAGVYVSVCLPPSLCAFRGRWKPVHTKQLVLDSLPGALNTQLSSHPL